MHDRNYYIQFKVRNNESPEIDTISCQIRPGTPYGKVNTRKHHPQESQEVSALPAGDHKATRTVFGCLFLDLTSHICCHICVMMLKTRECHSYRSQTNPWHREVRYTTNSKTGLKRPLKKDKNLFFKTDNRLMQVKSIAECPKRAFCNTSTCIKLAFFIKIFVLSIFGWPFYAGFTVY